MKASEALLMLLGVLALVVLVLILGSFVTAIMWQWVIPDILPGAVDGGLVKESLTLWEALKLNLFLGFMIGTYKTKK